ncbi:MAG: 2,3-bisphosphoglycerate-independent phosphoglycerate mutase [Candidatus Aminicenantes bacterium]|nr:2,3-bisphosphoglycerate-independent phosphoglycerate mutase [Candidatus Aminicenantes bacterium]
MEREELFKMLTVRNEKKILLVVLDGLGGIPFKDGKTELEAANTPNLDALAKESSCGLSIPVREGITPGSGPAHLAIFGYDPIKYEIGRGILEALGVGMDVTKRDVAVRGNFATIENGIITDRRAGRIPTEVNRQLIKEISDRLKKIDDVEIILKSGREHRFVLILRGDGLSDEVSDGDPEKEGLPQKLPQPLAPQAGKTAEIASRFIKEVEKILKDKHPANTVLLRGFSKYPDIPSMEEIFKVKPAAIATYPMYRGLAKLVGMDILDTGESLQDEVNSLKENWGKYDFFYLHVKKTDSYGEDGNFENKVKVIEEFDAHLPQILALKPDVLVITGDHSTPSKMKSHSWHPVPFLLKSSYCFNDDLKAFTERECRKGSLGVFYAQEGMALMLANALRLKKFGA